MRPRADPVIPQVMKATLQEMSASLDEARTPLAAHGMDLTLAYDPKVAFICGVIGVNGEK